MNAPTPTRPEQQVVAIQATGLFLDPKMRTADFLQALAPLSLFRLDTTLIDFTDMKCQRGDLSFIFNGDAPPSQSFVVLDNEAKVYQRIHHEVSEPRLSHTRM